MLGLAGGEGFWNALYLGIMEKIKKGCGNEAVCVCVLFVEPLFRAVAPGGTKWIAGAGE